MDTLCLNRTWKFKLDPENVGISEGWQSNPKTLEQDSADIQVPCCWEELEQDYEGVAWYSTQVEIDADKAGQICRIAFQASNYRTGVWINGKAVGSHDGGYTPFDFEIQDFLNYGATNQITVRIVSPIITKDIRVDDLGPNDMPHWRGGLTAGIWQAATLEFNQSAWIKHAFYKPKVKDSAFDLDLEFRCNETSAQTAVLTVNVIDGSGAAVYEDEQTFELQPGSTQLSHTITLKEAKLWSCQSPHLYTAHASISLNGKVIAESTERIGLREFTYENERFCLNGERIYLRGGFWEGVYAKHQSYPDSREEVRREIELAQAAGLNLLRPWRRPVPPMILEEADAAGLLVIASPAVECMNCWPTITPETPARIENEIRQLVLRDRNHASIIWWEMFNEVTRKEIAELIPTMSLMTRELDETRLILDESGGWADGAHFYLPHSTERETLSELHSYVRAPVSEKHWKLYQDLGKTDTNEGNTEIKAGTGLFVSEFGFGGLPEIEANCTLFEEHGNPKLPAYRHHQKILKALKHSMAACDFDSIYEDVDTFCRASQTVQARGNRRQLEALLSNKNVSGYCIHAFTDGDWILGAGLIDHWQRPKEAYHAIAEANKTPSILCFPDKRNLKEGDTVEITIVLRGLNSPLPADIELSNGEVTFKLSNLNWSGQDNFQQTRAYIPSTLLNVGSNTISIRACNLKGEIERKNTIELFVVPEPALHTDAELVVYDPDADITPWLNDTGIAYTALSDWSANTAPTTLLVVPEDVASEADLPQLKAAMACVELGTANALFLEAPAEHDSACMLEEYEASTASAIENNQLLQSGIFPFKLVARPSFSFWESSMHVVKAHPIFKGLPTNCMMDEPYHEVAPAESFYELEADELPAQTITWFRPEEVATKAQKRTYLGGEELWHGTDVAVKAHGQGNIILSTLILRRKVAHDTVAQLLLSNLLQYSDTLHTRQTTATTQVEASTFAAK
ncbi:MAG: glycoside hydrolase family 2 TIM barrel-domain containing protein [Opitutae bacterium]|nr:glycoside hydrolase family 2 TIM barrel-domain containing protein [Opitutae bacterium]